MKELEINFVGSGNAVSVNNLLNTPIGNIFEKTDSYNVSMSSFVYEINKKFDLEESTENDIYNIFIFSSKELDCKIKIRISKDPDFIKLNQEEYNAILNITKRKQNIKNGVVYTKTAKKVLTPGKIVLATILTAVVIVGGIKIAKDFKEATNDPNNILYNLTHYVSTVPDVPTEVVNEQIRQQQQDLMQKEQVENVNIFK